MVVISPPHTRTHTGRQLEAYEEGQAEVSVAQVKAVRCVLKKLPSSSEDSCGDEAFTKTLMQGAQLAFPRHERRKEEALVRTWR